MSLSESRSPIPVSKPPGDATPDRKPFSEAALGDAFVALKRMSNTSKRGQADIEVAFNRANLRIDRSRHEEICECLVEKGLIKDVIVLDDGGIIVTVI